MMINVVMIMMLVVLPGCQWGIGSSSVHGNGVLRTEERSVSAFDSVKMSGRGTVIFTQGAEHKLVVEAEDSLMPYLETYGENHTLVIQPKQGIDIIPTMPII